MKTWQDRIKPETVFETIALIIPFVTISWIMKVAEEKNEKDHKSRQGFTK